jgi:hypothetical protein
MDGSHKSCFFVPCWVDGRINIDETLHLTETSEKIDAICVVFARLNIPTKSS